MKNEIQNELKRIYNLYNKKELSDENDENDAEGFWDFAFELLNEGTSEIKPYVKENDERTEITLRRDEIWTIMYEMLLNGYELYKNKK